MIGKHGTSLTVIQEELELEDTKEVVRIRKSKTVRQRNGQTKQDKQRPTKHYTENYKLSNSNLTVNQWWTHVLRKSKQFQFH